MKLKLTDITNELVNEIRLLIAGKSNPAKLNAITNATGKLISSIRIRLEYARACGVKPNIPELT